MKQEYDSRKTDICQVSGVFKSNGYPFPTGCTILDYGGGKCDKNINYMAQKGCQVIVYDPFNRSQEYNERTFDIFNNSDVQFITCNNVLNVIKEEEIIIDIIKTISELAQMKNATAIFTFHYGNRTGIGTPTERGWQRNNKISWYYDLISSLNCFAVVKKTKNMIICLPPTALSGKRTNRPKKNTLFNLNVRNMF